jgi:hypothetical protein
MVPGAERMSARYENKRLFLRGSPSREWASPKRRVRRPGWPSNSLLVFAFTMMVLLTRPPSRAVAAEGDLYVVLHYSVDASVRGCWEEAEFRRSVAHRIGYDPFREDAPLVVQVRVGGAISAVDGHVEWRKANGLLMGERRFVAKDDNCTKLLTEMSFAVGLQIELLRPKASAGGGAVSAAKGSGSTSGSAPNTTVVAAPPTSVATPSAPPTAATSAASSSTPPPATKSEADTTERPPAERQPRAKVADEDARSTAGAASRWPMWLGIGPSLAYRISPAVTADARLFLGLRRNDLSLEVGAEASYPSTERQRDGSGFRQTLIGGTLAICAHRQSLSACALGRASQVRISGIGVDKPRSPTGLVAQAGLRLAAALELGSAWFLAGHLDALGLLTSSTVQLNRVPVWEMPRLGLLAGIDLAARFR